MRELIIQLIEEKPKHFAQIIKKDAALYKEISNFKSPTNNISEQVFQYLNPTDTTCPNGNYKKFKSIKEGYKFCGAASVCQCAKESVSAKVSKTKMLDSEEKKKEINQKRIKTNLDLYGVSNTGMTELAKKRFSEFYNNVDKVSEVTLQIKNTKKENYGNENYNNSDQIKKTWQEKSTTQYWVERHDNENYHILQDKDKF
jgi:hypothetical protein